MEYKSKALKKLQSKSPQHKTSFRFNRLRKAHQTELAEDYVEMIFELIEEKGEARSVDLATRFGVSNPSVNATIRRLQKESLVISEPYRSIFLTKKGEDLAKYCKNRHETVYKFLISIGVNESTALMDAEGLEHHVSKETLNAFKKIIKTSE